MFARDAAGGEDGLGVGLTLAEHLARLHGGSIEVSSPGPGLGSEFQVHLPILLGTTVGPAQPVPESQPYRGHRVLVVDDNRDAADALASLLELEGNETHVAHDGASAVELAQSLRPEVLLLDIGLPRLNGYEVARRVRAQPWGASVLLIALTGWGHPEEQAKSIAAGFDHHLVKPADIGTVTDLLSRHAASSAR